MVGAGHCAHNLADKCWQAEESHRENHWNNTSSDQLNRQNAFDAAVASVASDALSVVDGNDSLRFVDLDQEV